MIFNPRKGQRVKFLWEAYKADHLEKMKGYSYRKMHEAFSKVVMADGTPLPDKVIESRLNSNPNTEATVTGSARGGNYANLMFDDGFECGFSTEFLERVYKKKVPHV